MILLMERKAENVLPKKFVKSGKGLNHSIHGVDKTKSQ